MLKVYRIGHWFYCHKLVFLSRFCEKVIHVLWAAQIPMSCQLARNVVFPHSGLGCVFYPGVKVGDGTIILQNVTLGQKKTKTQLRDFPEIGKNCLIGAGACILGGVIVHDNAKVGANAVVLCDVPENCIAVGVPAVIKKCND